MAWLVTKTDRTSVCRFARIAWRDKVRGGDGPFPAQPLVLAERPPLWIAAATS